MDYKKGGIHMLEAKIIRLEKGESTISEKGERTALEGENNIRLKWGRVFKDRERK